MNKQAIKVTTKQARNIALVYQNGIANVFEIEAPGKVRRLLQHAYSPCEWYAQGLRDAGNNLSVFYSDDAGDIANSYWHPRRGPAVRC